MSLLANTVSVDVFDDLIKVILHDRLKTDRILFFWRHENLWSLYLGFRLSLLLYLRLRHRNRLALHHSMIALHRRGLSHHHIVFIESQISRAHARQVIAHLH